MVRNLFHIAADTLFQFKELKGFECYRHYYAKREDAQRIFQREMLKKSTTGFAGYIEVRSLALRARDGS